MDNRHKLSIMQKIKFLLVGDRLHKWMYDSRSFLKFVPCNSEFKGVALCAGESGLSDELCNTIDLFEKQEESVYFEFKKK